MEGLALAEGLFPPPHEQHANCLRLLGISRLTLKQQPEAMALFQKSLDEYEGLGLGGSPGCGQVLNSIGYALQLEGRFAEAEPAHLRARDLLEKSPGHQPDLALALNNLGVLYWRQDRYEMAEPMLAASLRIREKTLGPDYPICAQSHVNLGSLYNKLGDYEAGERCLLRAKAIAERRATATSPLLGVILLNLGGLYLHMGIYPQAERYLTEAAALLKAPTGRQSIEYYRAISSFPVLFTKTGQPEKAIQLLTALVDEVAASPDAGLADHALLLINLGSMLTEAGRFAEARQRYLAALGFFEKMGQANGPDAALDIYNMASLAVRTGDLRLSDSLHQRALAIRAVVLGKDHPSNASSLDGLAYLRFLMGRPDEAAILFDSLEQLNHRLLARANRHLSERELEGYNDNFLLYRDHIFSFHERTGGPRSAATCFDNALFHKGFLLQASLAVRRRALADTTSARDWQLLASYHRRIATVLSRPPAADQGAGVLAPLEAAADSLEKILAQRVEGFGQGFRQVSWRDVRDALPEGSAAVEFVAFKKVYTDPAFPQKGDSTMYAALVVRPGWPAPRFVPLFEEKNFESAFLCDGPRPDLKECAAKRYGPASTGLHALVFAPLDSLLAGARTVFYSPAGQLHLLDLGGLPTGGGQVLADRYRLVRLGSTRSVAEHSIADYGLRIADLPGAAVDKSAVRNPQSAILFGGVFHNFDSTAIAAANDSLVRGGSWRFLPGTKKEVESAARLLEKKGISALALTGHAATEGAFKHMASGGRSRRVVHMAVHGFFHEKKAAGDSTSSVFETSPNPLLRSGLLLAGADRAFQKSRPAPADTLDDGVLTALEISHCDLRGTELVVLSACQSGLGDLHANEGVYGLQRAFKIAGARHLLMSLQEVPDRSAQEFTSLFYEKWLGGEGLPLPDAFRQAQAEMRRRHPAGPQDWAGWVLVE